MPPPAMTREAVTALIVVVAVRWKVRNARLRLRAGDERRQPADVGGGRLCRGRLILLRRRAVGLILLRLIVLRLMLRAALIMIRIRLLATVGLRLFAWRIRWLLVVVVLLIVEVRLAAEILL